MKNKKLTLLLCSVAVIACIGILIYAIGSMKPDVYYGTCGDNLKWTLYDGTLTFSGTGKMEDFGYNSTTKVYSLPTYYAYRKSIKEVSIAEGVTSIGKFAFRDCKRLKSVSIPRSVTYIGEYAFGNCKHLKSVSIPEGVESILFCTFEDCTRLTKVILPNSLKKIGIGAFSGCYSLSEITIPDGVNEIQQHAFYWCKSLLSVTIPNSVTKIGHGAFELCIFLREVHLPIGLEIIESCTFNFCFLLKSVTIPNTVKTIGIWAFDWCIALRSATIPESVTEVEEDSFGHTRRLTVFNASATDMSACGVPAKRIIHITQQEALARYFQDNPEQEQYSKQLEQERQKNAKQKKRKQQQQQTKKDKPAGHLKYNGIEICGKRDRFDKMLWENHIVKNTRVIEKTRTKHSRNLDNDTFYDNLPLGIYTFSVYSYITPKSEETFGVEEVIGPSTLEWNNIKKAYDAIKRKLIAEYGQPTEVNEHFSGSFDAASFQQKKAECSCTIVTDLGMVGIEIDVKEIPYEPDDPYDPLLNNDDRLSWILSISYIDKNGFALYEMEE